MQPDPHSHDNHTPDDASPRTLVTVPTEVTAQVIVSALAELGIEATSTGEYVSGFRAEAPGDVAVLVRQSDLARARSELARIRTDAEQIDWDSVDWTDDGDPTGDGSIHTDDMTTGNEGG